MKEKSSWEILLVVSLGLILILSLRQVVMMLGWFNNEPTTDCTIEIVDELITNGRLIIKTKEGQTIKFLMSSQNANNDWKNIDWNHIDNTISEVDTLYPKSDCKIILFSRDDERQMHYKIFEYSFSQFVESSFLSKTNSSAIEQLFKNTWPETLTIDIDGIIEESGKEINTDAFVELLKSSYNISKIELYQSKDTSVFSPNYPSIRTIYCKSK